MHLQIMREQFQALIGFDERNQQGFKVTPAAPLLERRL